MKRNIQTFLPKLNGCKSKWCAGKYGTSIMFSEKEYANNIIKYTAENIKKVKNKDFDYLYS